jgi:hypothetical protein
MIPRGPIPANPERGVSPSTDGGAAHDASAWCAVLSSLMSTGMSLKDACGSIARDVSAEAAHAAMAAWLTGDGVDGHVDLSFCEWLTAIPEGTRVTGILTLGRCPNLSVMPVDFHVGNALDLTGCHGLKSLPEGFGTDGMLSLNDCVNLASLPDGFSVGKGLYMDDCRFLVSLPPRMKVGGWISMADCSSWDGLFPSDLVAEGIYTDEDTLSMEKWRTLHPERFRPHDETTASSVGAG